MKTILKKKIDVLKSRINNINYMLSKYKASHPNFLQIEVSNLCNLNCLTCGRHEFLSKFGSMDIDIFEQILNKFDLSKVKKIHLGGYGEPLMNKYFIEMIKKIPSDIYTVTNTNLSFANDKLITSLAKSGINEINVSMDGFDKKTYESIRRGGHWENIIKNIQLINSYKERGMKLNIHCVVYHTNIKSYVANISRVLNTMYFDKIIFVGMKPHGFNDATESNKDYFDSKELSQIKSVAESKHIEVNFNRNKPIKNCFRPFHDIYITFNGEITPCCNIVDGSYYSFGNLLNENSFDNIWNSYKAIKFRKDLIKGPHNQLCKTICGLGKV